MSCRDICSLLIFCESATILHVCHIYSTEHSLLCDGNILYCILNLVSLNMLDLGITLPI